MQYDIAKQDVHTITVNCVCPVGVHGISDFEVFVHENEHRLVIKAKACCPCITDKE